MKTVADSVRKVSEGFERCENLSGRLSYSARKVPYGVWKVSHGARKVSKIARKLSNGARKVSHGARKVSHGARKVLQNTLNLRNILYVLLVLATKYWRYVTLTFCCETQKTSLKTTILSFEQGPKRHKKWHIKTII